MARSSAATRRQALRSCSTTRRWQVWQDDERVRAGELELLHDAFELDRIFLIEHRERVMRKAAPLAATKAQLTNTVICRRVEFPLVDRFHGSRDAAAAL